MHRRIIESFARVVSEDFHLQPPPPKEPPPGWGPAEGAVSEIHYREAVQEIGFELISVLNSVLPSLLREVLPGYTPSLPHSSLRSFAPLLIRLFNTQPEQLNMLSVAIERAIHCPQYAFTSDEFSRFKEAAVMLIQTVETAHQEAAERTGSAMTAERAGAAGGLRQEMEGEEAGPEREEQQQMMSREGSGEGASSSSSSSNSASLGSRLPRSQGRRADREEQTEEEEAEALGGDVLGLGWVPPKLPGAMGLGSGALSASRVSSSAAGLSYTASGGLPSTLSTSTVIMHE